MTDKPISYIVYDDIPLSKFENFVMPPMRAMDVILLLAAEGEDALSPDAASDVRRLLVDEMMPQNQQADRGEIEAFVDQAIAEVRSLSNLG